MAKNVTIQEFDEELKKDLEALHRAIGVESSDRIIDNAPVDEGNLRGSVNLSKDGTVVTDNPDPSGSSTKASNTSNAKSIELEDDYFVIVGEEYARFIDEGSSNSAPTGFFSTVVNNWKPIVEKAEKRMKEFRDN